ncbi:MULTISPECIES: AraC family transcriptional regulator [unclassified Modicisalibacter]|uniref:helix-turn-helix transcriptional regulator n=1 Tax=unclassified Modicisalibacter TaxID=2679913 RepID=UPI001CCF17E7|nr:MULTISPECIES: AraC family transcriptional regulator [unclassified Modicisalibacter]MBZ9558329.1 helix-turn-helix domain-containing protein [Modicisalibacter sp. R2A 31.J]MBZ9575779.1 helix-turn-helix domain-containing protein [Modicisalibacter sp. MOD 31.J]
MSYRLSPLVEVRDYPDRVLTDRHVFHQLLLGLDGHVELEAAGRATRVAPGVLAPVVAGDTHHYLAPADNRILVVDLPVDWCRALDLDAALAGPSRRLPDALVARGRRLEHASPPVLAAWLGEVASAAARPVAVPRLRLLELLPAIRADLAHPWRVAEMAARCHLAEAAFARQFRALTGRPPHVWLTAQRLALARTRLRDPRASLTEIALACGFADAAHFSRVFRRHLGCPPGEWRRALPERLVD